MFILNCWILSSLFLGHLIAGVNRKVSNSVPESPAYRGLLSPEARQILYYYRTSENVSDYADDILPSSRRVPSLASSFPLVCPPSDSCINRCGETPRTLPYTCNCDSLCTIFTDCCGDYVERCGNISNETTDADKSLAIPRLGCDILFMKYNLLTVSKCPDGYEDAPVKKLCSLKIPKECNFPDNLNVSEAGAVYNNCANSVQRRCMAKLRHKCDSAVEPICSLLEKRCKKAAKSRCRRCETSFWPVLGKNGIMYRNSYCSLCNSLDDYTILSPASLEIRVKEKAENNVTSDNLYFTRHCIPVNFDSCPLEMGDTLQELCHNHSGAVITKSGKGNVIYKNTHCAVCNGEKFENLQCATKGLIMRGLIRPLLENFITGDNQGIIFDDIPAAFSILLNFGLDGRERMYFSSEGEEEMKRNQEKCGAGRIWDPFSQVCRRLYCSTEFVLVDYRCVKKETAENGDFISKNETTSIIPDASAEFVHLSLSAEMEVLDILQFYDQDIEAVCETIRESLAKSFEIHIERIKNVRFNITFGFAGSKEEILKFIEVMDDLHPITFQIHFDLYEGLGVNITQPEPTVDRIVSMLASSLSMNGFEFDINNVTSRIFEIHQTVSPLESWCTAAQGGKKKEYWNSEFSLILDDEYNSTFNENRIEGIYVNKTGNFYRRGKFVVDILFQGYQFSSSLINVSGVAIVCEEVKLNESCIRVLIGSHEYSIFENGTLNIYNESLRQAADESAYEKAENNSVFVCIKSLKAITSNKIYKLDMDVVQAMVSFVLLWVSVVAMTAVLVTYVAFGSLRNLPGCNTMNLTFSVLAMQLTFIFGLRGTVKGAACIAVGYLLHYEILCCFMWMNVMAFDLFRTFGDKNALSSIRSKRKYLPRYMIYAYMSPLTIILSTSLVDYFAFESAVAPHYGMNNVCWINNPNSATIFFAAPLAVIMTLNGVLFTLTILAMKSVKNLSSVKDQQSQRNGKNDLFLYVRMALVIGLTWSLSFAAAFVRQTELAGQILTYLFIIFNTLQGVFLFWVFVCNKRVYELYKDAFRKAFRTLSKHAKNGSSSATIAKYADGMKRSASNKTVVSTLSNASVSSNESALSKNKLV